MDHHVIHVVTNHHHNHGFPSNQGGDWDISLIDIIRYKLPVIDQIEL